MKVLTRLNKITAAPKQGLDKILDFADLDLQDDFDDALNEGSSHLKDDAKKYSNAELQAMYKFWNAKSLIVRNYLRELRDFQKQINSTLDAHYKSIDSYYAFKFDTKLGEVEQEMKKRK